MVNFLVRATILNVFRHKNRWVEGHDPMGKYFYKQEEFAAQLLTKPPEKERKGLFRVVSFCEVSNLRFEVKL